MPGIAFVGSVRNTAAAIPNAIVEFNDELKTTALTGTVHFTAPQVEEDTYYDINANKDGYTGDTETILVKDVPYEFVSTLILGRIDNLTTGGDVITFEAVNIWCVTFFPFTYNAYSSGDSCQAKLIACVGRRGAISRTMTGGDGIWEFTRVDSLTITSQGVGTWSITDMPPSEYCYILVDGQANNGKNTSFRLDAITDNH